MCNLKTLLQYVSKCTLFTDSKPRFQMMLQTPITLVFITFIWP